MKYLSPLEATDWLRLRGMIEAPYAIKPSPLPWKQYPAPAAPAPVNALIKRVVDSKPALLVFVDWLFRPPEEWQFYKPHQIGFVEAMHDLAAQHTDFSKGLALVYDATECEDLTSHLDISLELGWSVYLYSETAGATMLFWEGDLIDVWSRSRTIFAEADRLLS